MPPRRSKKAKSVKSRIQVRFIAGFGPVVQDDGTSRALYEGALRLPFEELGPGYLATDKVDGAKHFALWPLSQAAESCFGTSEWPRNLPIPQAWVEFDVADIASATAQLRSEGYELLVSERKEPWGQTVTRFLSPEGILVGVTVTPSMRGEK
jgi:hypothetical protein